MKFDFKNKDKIENLYIHDSIFNGFYYDYEKRQIKFSCKNYFLQKMFYFVFNNVILCNIQSCSFWHGGNNILEIYLKSDNLQMEQLMKTQNSNQELYSGSYLDKGIIYFSVEMQMNSGDTILIICEAIDVLEENLTNKTSFS